MKNIIWLERGTFDYGDSEHDDGNEKGRSSIDSTNNRETPRRNTPIHGNDNAEDKNKMLPNRIIDMPDNVSRRQVFHILFCEKKDDVHEVKRRRRLLAWKHHPAK